MKGNSVRYQYADHYDSGITGVTMG